MSNPELVEEYRLQRLRKFGFTDVVRQDTRVYHDTLEPLFNEFPEEFPPEKFNLER